MQHAAITVRNARWTALDTDSLYEIVRLRNRVFALEQRVEAEDFDGRDREPETEHWWVPDDDGGVRAYLRLLRPRADEAHPPSAPPARWVIGRVATDPAHRGLGLARGLVAAVLGTHGAEPIVLHAQEYVAGLYAASGFEPFGDAYEEAGIRHIGMYRPGRSAEASVAPGEEAPAMAEPARGSSAPQAEPARGSSAARAGSAAVAAPAPPAVSSTHGDGGAVPAALPTARRYAEYARRIAAVSPTYAAWAERVDAGVLEVLDTVAPTNRQPELAFAVARALGADPYDPDAFTALVRAQSVPFVHALAAATMQTNDPRRMAPIVPILGTLAQRSEAPIGLVEIGASAGLTLIPDRVVLDYRTEQGGVRIADAPEPALPLTAVAFGTIPEAVPPFRLAARVGLDPAPIDLAEPGAFGALERSVPPEAADRISLMREAMRVTLAEPPTLMAGTVQENLDDALDSLPPECMPVVVTSGTLVYVPGLDRQRFVDRVRERGVHWISFERTGVLVEVAQREPVDMRASLSPDDRFATIALDGRPLAYSDPFGTCIHWFDVP